MTVLSAVANRAKPLVSGGSVDKATLIVKIGRGFYLVTATGITALSYAAWRSERVAEGEGSFPIPFTAKARRLKARYEAGGKASDIPSGYVPGVGAALGITTGQVGGTPAGGMGGISGSGGWGGSEGVCKGILKAAGVPESAWGSQKRSTQGTASGGISDHWTGCKACYAVDGAPVQKYVDGIMKVLGLHYTGGPVNWPSVEKGGYRIQVGWLVADHYDHFHIGVRKVGYSP